MVMLRAIVLHLEIDYAPKEQMHEEQQLVPLQMVSMRIPDAAEHDIDDIPLIWKTNWLRPYARDYDDVCTPRSNVSVCTQS